MVAQQDIHATLQNTIHLSRLPMRVAERSLIGMLIG